MRKEFWRQLTLSMCAMDPLVWSYYLSSRLEGPEHHEELERPQEQRFTVVPNGDPSIVAERRTAA